MSSLGELNEIGRVVDADVQKLFAFAVSVKEHRGPSADFDGSEPVEMKVRDEVVRETQHEIGYVLYAALYVATSRRGYRLRLPLYDVIHY